MQPESSDTGPHIGEIAPPEGQDALTLCDAHKAVHNPCAACRSFKACRCVLQDATTAPCNRQAPKHRARAWSSSGLRAASCVQQLLAHAPL